MSAEANLYPDHCPHGFPSEPDCPICRRANNVRLDRNVVSISRNATDTSKAAGLKRLPKTGTKRAITYDLIKRYPEGLCDHEIEAITGWLHQSASSVRNSLMRDGLIRDSGIRRQTPGGNDAIAWKATDDNN
jgi:hypothetical protein